MTFEELKEEAARQGYRLIKFKKYIRIEPCTCGSRKRLHFTKWDGQKLWISLTCISCGKPLMGRTQALPLSRSFSRTAPIIRTFLIRPSAPENTSTAGRNTASRKNDVPAGSQYRTISYGVRGLQGKNST